MSDIIILPVPEFGEEYPVELHLNYEIDWADMRCPHITDGKLKRALIAYNESKHDCTIICLDCLLNWAKEHLNE